MLVGEGAGAEGVDVVNRGSGCGEEGGLKQGVDVEGRGCGGGGGSVGHMWVVDKRWVILITRKKFLLASPGREREAGFQHIYIRASFSQSVN